MSKKLFIICGHGNGDSGACGNGYTEAERVRALGKRIKELGGDNVILGDVNRNFYTDKGISNLELSKEDQILELHMDSSSNVTAKGAHIIIKEGYNPDDYDNKIANFLSNVFPGRSEIIVKRSNLANANRAASKNYSYRLAECGFISNAEDVSTFNNNLENIAIGILKCFDIDTTNGDSNIIVNTPTNENSIPQTNKANGYDDWVARLQKELNIQGFRDDNGNKLDVDGLKGTKTLQACPVIKKGASGGLTKLVQERLNSVDFSISVDGVFGYNTEKAIKVFQTNRGLSSDGIIGKNTWEWLLKGTKM